jgi:hypothetical protein
MSHRLDAYLTLERVMLELDQKDAPTADAIRDVMDPLWHSLSSAEHEFLDSRNITEIHRLNPVTLTLESIFLPRTERVESGGEEIRAREVGKRYPLDEVLAA